MKLLVVNQRGVVQHEFWSQSIKGKVREFKKLLKDHKSTLREDLGFIVTHQSLDQY